MVGRIPLVSNSSAATTLGKQPITARNFFRITSCSVPFRRSQRQWQHDTTGVYARDCQGEQHLGGHTGLNAYWFSLDTELCDEQHHDAEPGHWAERELQPVLRQFLPTQRAYTTVLCEFAKF